MNPLASILLIANPLVTAALAVVVFLESKKQRNLLEAVEKALRESTRQVIEAVERQKEGFDAIATSLRVISEDQGKSVETFTGISNALTTSSRTNEHSLKNVVSALDAATLKTEVTMASLSQTIEKSNNDLKVNMKTAYSEASAAITSVGDKIGDEYTKLADRLLVYEKNTTDAFEKTIISQQELNSSLAKSFSDDTKTLKEGIAANSNETFTGISNALTTSSRTNEHSLKNVVSALDAATLKTEVTMASLSQTIEKSNNDLKVNMKTAYSEASAAITSVGDKIGDEYTKLADRLLVYEKNTTDAFEKTIISQQELNSSLAKSFSDDTKTLKEGIAANSKELAAIDSTLKKAVSI